MIHTWKKTGAAICVACGMMASWAMTSFAGEWKQQDNAWYYYDDQGTMQTGWVWDAGAQRWYYTDTETGVWKARPVINQEAACHLVENAVRKAGYYQDEKNELTYKVDESSDQTIWVSVRVESKPDYFETLNSYEIDRKTGVARPAVGKKFSLYE